MKTEVYVFSGLGADYRVFQNIELNDFNLNHILWIPPLNNESIAAYAKRLLSQIKTPNPVLIGLSFGGIIAVEVAKLIETNKVILISSIKSKYEIPPYFRLAGKFKLHRLLPAKFLKTVNFLSYWFFGIETKMDKQLLKQILFDTNPQFLKWAINEIVMWKNEIILNNIYHIHGDDDHILPSFYIKPDVLIPKGGHFMILNKAEQIEAILNTHLKQ